MAETTIHLAGKDVTLSFRDGAGSPLSYSVKLTEGTLTIFDGEYEHTIPEGMDGEVLSGAVPRQAGVRNRCGFSLSCKVFDIGDDDTNGNYTFLDLARFEGDIGETWTPTLLSPDTNMKAVYDGRITIADRVSGVTTIKGGTYDFPDVMLEGNQQIEVTRDGGWIVNGQVWRSVSTVRYDVTRNP